MEKITSIANATQIIYEKVKTINPEVEEEDIYYAIVDEVFESLKEELSEDDINILEEHQDDKKFIDTYLQKKISDYAELLTEIVEDMTSDAAFQE